MHQPNTWAPLSLPQEYEVTASTGCSEDCGSGGGVVVRRGHVSSGPIVGFVQVRRYDISRNRRTEAMSFLLGSTMSPPATHIYANSDTTFGKLSKLSRIISGSEIFIQRPPYGPISKNDLGDAESDICPVAQQTLLQLPVCR